MQKDLYLSHRLRVLFSVSSLSVYFTMASGPAWAQRSTIWISNHTKRTLRASQLIRMKIEVEIAVNRLDNAERRIALEIYETNGEGILSQLDVYAVEQ